MIDTPRDLVCDLKCMQQASYLEGGPLMWMLPLYLQVNKKSNVDVDDDSGNATIMKHSLPETPKEAEMRNKQWPKSATYETTGNRGTTLEHSVGRVVLKAVLFVQN